MGIREEKEKWRIREAIARAKPIRELREARRESGNESLDELTEESLAITLEKAAKIMTYVNKKAEVRHWGCGDSYDDTLFQMWVDLTNQLLWDDSMAGDGGENYKASTTAAMKKLIGKHLSALKRCAREEHRNFTAAMAWSESTDNPLDHWPGWCDEGGFRP
jgi:hypothetical protein